MNENPVFFGRKASTPSFSSLADLQPLPQQSGSPASNGPVGEELLVFEKNHKVFQHAWKKHKNCNVSHEEHVKASKLPGFPLATHSGAVEATRTSGSSKCRSSDATFFMGTWAPGAEGLVVIILQQNNRFMTCSHPETGEFKWQCTWIYENIDDLQQPSQR